MGNESCYVTLGLKAWKAQIDRADKLFGEASRPKRFCGKSRLAGIGCSICGDT